jgi:hypothetical protein
MDNFGMKELIKKDQKLQEGIMELEQLMIQ